MRLELLGDALDVDESLLSVEPADIERQAREYAAGERRSFDCDVAFPDSFTGDVMRAIAAIPYGETRTYGELARDLETSARAVGGGCGRNPVPLVVPCHRVVASDGSLGGFSAEGGVALKRRLLDHEAANR